MTMYVYIRTEAQLWTVGFYDPKGKFIPESDHDSPDQAAQRVAWLNGSRGDHQEFTEQCLNRIENHLIREMSRGI